jgi:ethanolamine utilization protein EutA
LTTVGIDIGSATTHFLASRITMRRLGLALMSRYEVVERQELFRSQVAFTPYRSSNEIDSDALSEYFAGHLEHSGLSYADIDTGVVMLTGEAARKQNARGIAQLFARTVGKFVCTSAGHHLEARMAAQGSGAVEDSRLTGRDVVNVDIGGGTAKFSLISGGAIVATSALNVGARVIVQRDGVVTRIDAAAARVARELGVNLALGQPADHGSLERLAAQMADCVTEYLTTEPPYSPLTTDLFLTEPIEGISRVARLVFSGGVSEYIANPNAPVLDLGRDLARHIVEGLARQGRTFSTAAERMRATVVGLSQFTTQVSGDTVFVSSPTLLPITNVPVLTVNLDSRGLDEPDARKVATLIEASWCEAGRDALLDVVALNIIWSGKPYYRNLCALADGVALAAEQAFPAGPLVVVLSQDYASSLGRVLQERAGNARDIVCIDGLRVGDDDIIDVGSLMQQDTVLPIVVKTLVFPNLAVVEPDSAHSVPAVKETIGQLL